jgi:YebC/PmpR family DNA-binding regulatory protein
VSGHSKWHNIRLKKAKVDAQRGKIFTRLAREIIVAAKSGGGTADGNPRLRTLLQRAREAGMPQDNVRRAIQRGTGELDGVVYEEIVYEGYAPGGVAVMVECLTDNRNRIVSEVRSTFTRCGGNLGEAGCVAYLFDQKGVILVPAEATEEDALLEVALEAGAEDVQSEDGMFEVTTAPQDLEPVREAIEAKGLALDSAEVTMVPKSTVTVQGKEAVQVLRLMEALDNLEDVQKVYANFDIPDSLLEQAAA